MPSRSIEDGHNGSGHFFPPHDMLFLTGALDARPISFSITSTGIFAVRIRWRSSLPHCGCSSTTATPPPNWCRTERVVLVRGALAWIDDNEQAARAFREMSSSFARWGLRAVRRYTYADPFPVANQ
jgi:hypothetical protein